MYEMEISVSGQQCVFLFRQPRSRKAMFEWWRDHLRRAKAGEDIRNIRVWGTVGNKTDIVLEWPRAMASRTRKSTIPTAFEGRTPTRTVVCDFRCFSPRHACCSACERSVQPELGDVARVLL